MLKRRQLRVIPSKTITCSRQHTCFYPVGIKDFLSQIQDFDSSQQNYIIVLKKGAELMINEALRGIINREQKLDFQ